MNGINIMDSVLEGILLLNPGLVLNLNVTGDLCLTSGVLFGFSNQEDLPTKAYVLLLVKVAFLCLLTWPEPSFSNPNILW